MDESVKISKIEPSDNEKLFEIEQKCFSDPWSIGLIKSLFEDKNSHFVSIRLEDEIIGYGGIRIIAGEANLDNIAIIPSHRGLGYGKILLEKLIEIARKLGAERIMLEVRQSNQSAISLYESVGFNFVGNRKNYYTKPKEAAVLMNLEVNDGKTN